jgi:cyclic pyranopterin phosphate synthase
MAAEPELTHLNEAGEVRMVDVGSKEVTDREAIAEAHVVMDPGLAERFFAGDLPKGDAAAAARLAGPPDHPHRARCHARAEWAWDPGHC